MSNVADGAIAVGVGHAERQDDGVGPYVARELGRRGFPAVVHQGDGVGLLDVWEGRPACLVIDAVAGCGAPGSIRVFTDFDDPVFTESAFVNSSHQLGLREAVALGYTLGRLPASLTVIGITGAAFGFGGTLSPAVEAAAKRVIERLAGAEDVFGSGTLAGLQPEIPR